MTSKEFVIWLKGFSEACNDYHPTPAQWEKIKDVLDKVVEQKSSTAYTYPFGTVTNVPCNATYTNKTQLND